MFTRFWIIYLTLFILGIHISYSQKDEKNFIDLKSKLEANTLSQTKKISILNQISEYLINLDNKKAFKYAQEALQLAKKYNNQNEEAKSNIILADLYFANQKTSQAKECIDIAIKISQDKNTPNIEINALRTLANHQIRKKDRRLAFNTIGKVKQLSENNDYTYGLGQAYILLGDWFRKESAKEAIKNYDKALNIFQFDNRLQETILILCKLGKTYNEQRDFENAINYHQQALKIGEQLNNPRLITTSLNRLGDTYNQSNNYRVALQYYFQAYIIALEYDFFNDGKALTNAVKGIRDTYANLVNTTDTQVKKDEYKSLYNQYRNIYKELQKSNYDIGKYQQTANTLQNRANELPLEKKYRLLAIEKQRLEIDNLAKSRKISLLEEAQKKAKLRTQEDSILVGGLHDKIAELNRQQNQTEIQIGDLQQKNAKQEKVISQKQGALTWWIIGLGLITFLAVLYAIYKSQKQNHTQNYQEDKLKLYNERINRQEVSLREKDDNLMQKQKELHNAYAELDDAKLEKKALTQILDEEVKPPLSTIIKESENESINRLVVHQSGKQMLNLITSIVTIQNLDKAKLNLFKEKISVYKLIENALKQVSELVKQKEIKTNNNVKTFFYIEADYDVIEHALLNLLYNSIKYTPIKGKINIDATTKNIDKQKYIEIKIEDNGQVIPQENLKLVFDKFNNEDARPDALNLPFVKFAIEAHDGKVNVNSNQNITQFTFMLPSVKPEVIKDKNISNKTIQVDSINNDELLTIKDKEILQPYLFELRQLEIFETTSLIATMNEINFNDNPRIKEWKKEIRKAIYNLDENTYKELIA